MIQISKSMMLSFVKLAAPLFLFCYYFAPVVLEIGSPREVLAGAVLILAFINIAMSGELARVGFRKPIGNESGGDKSTYQEIVYSFNSGLIRHIPLLSMDRREKAVRDSEALFDLQINKGHGGRFLLGCLLSILFLMSVGAAYAGFLAAGLYSEYGLLLLSAFSLFIANMILLTSYDLLVSKTIEQNTNGH